VEGTFDIFRARMYAALELQDAGRGSVPLRADRARRRIPGNGDRGRGVPKPRPDIRPAKGDNRQGTMPSPMPRGVPGPPDDRDRGSCGRTAAPRRPAARPAATRASMPDRLPQAVPGRPGVDAMSP